ncbi:uncharacterized protein LMH87_008670 [Akanthomyces muscarius]|uniref:Zn(2)-C6 fungal-type domain-containing protein n=1 Tax=Akanthomyces muscarius TaxID=2231603 RepID=A0A9W8QK59_AKAMU|nr:uncharacterized protein LMH87_008670 [Akanthomyces muscarius]KAJ4158130.1 hypothetical protein LMH87_008670 [Akanthomyces muscarius]
MPAHAPAQAVVIGASNKPRMTVKEIRTRTGCLTCRQRRIKCDERKPTCHRCFIGRRECSGLGYGLPRGNLVPPRQQAPTVKRSMFPGVNTAKAGRVHKEPVPPDWPLMQAVKYYNIKMQQTLDPAVPRHDVAYYFNFSRIIPDVYICSIVSFYLVACFKVRGQILKPGEEPSLGGTWSRYYEYLGKTLGIVNDCIRGVGPWSRRIGGFGPILNMFDSDFVLNGSTWPAHANGAFAYIDSVGGMHALLRENFQLKGYRAIALLM